MLFRSIRHVPKYERYKKSKSRIYAHSPDCIGAKEDDVVKVAETRKLSKTKSFVVLEVVGKKRVVKAEDDTFVQHRRTDKEAVNEKEEAKNEEPAKKKETEEKKETEKKEEKE